MSTVVLRGSLCVCEPIARDSFLTISRGFMRPVRFQLRLTHKIAAIGFVGVVGLAAVGLIYQQGTWAQDGVRKVAEDARAILGLTKRISIEMLEARRDEKNFLLRKQESYVKHHAQLSGV